MRGRAPQRKGTARLRAHGGMLLGAADDDAPALAAEAAFANAPDMDRVMARPPLGSGGAGGALAPAPQLGGPRAAAIAGRAAEALASTGAGRGASKAL